MFQRDQLDGAWIPDGRLVAPFQRGLDEFGGSVAIEGDLAIITAQRSDLYFNDGGAAFTFERTDFGWSLRDRLLPVAPNDRIQFGSAVALDDGVAAIGAWLDGEDRSASGSVTLYRPIAPDCDANGVADICDIASGLFDDVDADGVPDACACTGDLNGDRRVDTSDLGILISQFGMSDTPADLNLDGVTDQTDLGMLIQGFGLVCLP